MENIHFDSATTESYRLPVVDLYGAVHKGLRLALCELIERMGQTDAGDREGVQRALDDLEGMLELCERHASHEDAHLHRAVERRHAGGSASFAADHEKQHGQLARLRRMAHAAGAASPDDQARAFRALQLEYAAFVGENLVHMSREETQLQAWLDALYTPEELQAIHAQLVGNIGPEEMQAFMRPMLRAATPVEREQMLAIAAAAHADASRLSA